MGFLYQNSVSRHATTSIKGSKDADDRLIFKQIWSQKWLIGLAPRASQNWSKILCDVTPREPLTQIKKIFSIQIRRLAEPVKDLNSSLDKSAGELWPEM